MYASDLSIHPLSVMVCCSYMPLYLHKALHMDPGPAAQAASLYPLAQLIALVLASMYYDRLTSVARLFTITALIFTVFLVFTLQLILLMGRLWLDHCGLYLSLIFVAGFCISVPYYLPGALFIVQAGGKRHGE